MKLPNKVISYNESILSKFSIILNYLSLRDYAILDMYEKIKNKFEDVNEFMVALDCLYILGKIEITKERRLHYVK